MRIPTLLCPALALLLAACEAPPDPTPRPAPTPPASVFPSIGAVERLDPALDSLISTNAVIEKLGSGFKWAEGPVWVRTSQGERFILFSDIPPNKIYKWSEAGGLVEFLHPSGYTGTTPRSGEPGSNGLLLDRFGRLVLCQHGDRRIARLGISLNNPRPVFETIVDRYQGKRFNSPNDACYSKNGDLYFTDPPYGLEKRMADPAKELSFQGVYRLSRDGELKLLTDKIAYPNGIALSPDESVLYVAESGPDTKIHAFQVKPDGTIDEGRIFFDPAPLRQGGRQGGCDGLKVDVNGNLFATGPGGVLILSPTGKHLGTINTGTRIANVGWGDDGSTLYLTAHMYLCRVHTKTKGAGF